jgi:hypothetical protein
MPGFIHR